ncbi:MAG: helix-turn-helix domain-containing protein, partial [Pseudomonadota bacterium]|nr:helix-turn-helix domain-containing protein [Pseudomonadota bacterium]
MTDPLYHLTWLSRPLMQQVETAVEHGLQGTGLTVRTRAVMEVLLQGPLTVPALAEALHIQRQYVQVMVNEALAAGFVSKQA